METHPMYPDDLSEVEEKLGFEKVLVNNPDFQYYGHSSIVPAVVFRLNMGDMIIKISDPNGNISYTHQIYGIYGSKGRPSWLPVLIPIPNPQMAIRVAQSGQDLADPIAPKITPDIPSISLRCPKCLEAFEMNTDHLSLDGLQKCDSCSFESPNETFANRNL